MHDLPPRQDEEKKRSLKERESGTSRTRGKKRKEAAQRPFCAREKGKVKGEVLPLFVRKGGEKGRERRGRFHLLAKEKKRKRKEKGIYVSFPIRIRKKKGRGEPAASILLTENQGKRESKGGSKTFPSFF